MKIIKFSFGNLHNLFLFINNKNLNKNIEKYMINNLIY